MAETENIKNISEFEDKSLLIVDDDNPFRERLARAMEKKGFEVSQAQGVKEGLSSVKSKKPAFAVVDLRLGDGNGPEVVKEVKIFTPHHCYVKCSRSKQPRIHAAVIKGGVAPLCRLRRSHEEEALRADSSLFRSLPEAHKACPYFCPDCVHKLIASVQVEVMHTFSTRRH